MDETRIIKSEGEAAYDCLVQEAREKERELNHIFRYLAALGVETRIDTTEVTPIGSSSWPILLLKFMRVL